MSIVIDLRPVISAGVGASLSVCGHCDVGTLRLGELEFIPRRPVSYQLSFSNAGECVHALGSVDSTLGAVCSRCLADFELSLAVPLEEAYYREPTSDEHGEVLEVIGEEDTIDIEPLLIESLLVAFPFAPVCDQECRGLCAGCGADLNVEPCSCVKKPESNHPFAALRDMIQ